MKLITLVPTALLALTAGAVYAQDTGAAATPKFDAAATEAGTQPDFATADTDKDGLLSIAELQTAMPDLKITDENADGFVNQSEAESSIAGLAFESNGFTGGSSLVSEPEYGLIISHLVEGGADAASDAGTPGGAVDSGESTGNSREAGTTRN